MSYFVSDMENHFIKALVICIAIISTVPLGFSRPGDSPPLEHNYCVVNGVISVFRVRCFHADFDQQDGRKLGENRPWMG